MAMGHYTAEKIPNCEAEFIKGAGHLGLFEHLPEMLEAVIKKICRRLHFLSGSYKQTGWE